MNTKLCKLTLLVAFPADEAIATDGGLEDLGNTLADHLRTQTQALTVSCEYESVDQDLPDPEDTDAVIDALAERFPPTFARRVRRRHCGAQTTDSHRTSTCRLAPGHDGWHVDTKHPLHPTWP